MTVKERVIFEVDVAQWAVANYSIFDDRIDAWVRECGVEMARILGS